MKKFKKVICLFLVIALSLGALTAMGCEKEEVPVYVTGIAKTESVGSVDVYTIYYSNGTTSTMTVTNGENGKDATALDFYNEYVKQYGEISYKDFLSLFMTFETGGYSTINACLSSTAKVYSAFDVRNSESLYPTISSTKKAMFAGSAVIIDIGEEYTYLLTNYHVIFCEDAVGSKTSEEIVCYLYGSERYPEEKESNTGNYYEYGEFAISCEYVGGSPTYDVAIIRAKTQRVNEVNPNVSEVEFASDYYVGETAIAIGNPNDAGLSVTQGVVSVDNEFIYLEVDGTLRTHRSIRIDTALYEGNSGGGLFNKDGKLIGLCNAGNTTDQNINYAIPLSILKGAISNIMYYYNDGNAQTNGLYKITVGVTVTGKNSRFVFDSITGFGKVQEEVKVESIVEGSIAEKLGLQAGDIITHFNYDGNSISVKRYFEIGDYILNLRAGSVFNINYIRDGKECKTQSYQVKASDLVLA